MGKPEGKGPLGRLRSTHKDNTKMDRKEMGWESVHWINAAHDEEKWRAHVNTIMNLLVPSNVRNFLRAETLSASQEGLCSMRLVTSLEVLYDSRQDVLFITFISLNTRAHSNSINRTS